MKFSSTLGEAAAHPRAIGRIYVQDRRSWWCDRRQTQAAAGSRQPRRVVAATRMNERSSRSHLPSPSSRSRSAFAIGRRRTEVALVPSSTWWTPRVQRPKTGVGGRGLKEGAAIVALSALDCHQPLAEAQGGGGKKDRPHSVSRLEATRLLQESLGNARCTWWPTSPPPRTTPTRRSAR